MPVVKGNGYGFGRSVLARIAEDIVAAHRHTGVPPSIAVGTTHELAGLPSRLRPVVLTPPGARLHAAVAGRARQSDRHDR